MLQPEVHQSIDEHMCKFKGKNMMIQYMKNKPIKWGCKFFFFFLWSQVWLVVWIRYVSWKERKYQIWSHWICYSFIVPEAQRCALFCILWQLFYKSSTVGQAVTNGDLCDRYCEGQPKEYASFEAWQGDETQRAWLVFFKSPFSH